MMWIMKDANTTTQPQPPSGGGGSTSSSSLGLLFTSAAGLLIFCPADLPLLSVMCVILFYLPRTYQKKPKKKIPLSCHGSKPEKGTHCSLAAGSLPLQDRHRYHVGEVKGTLSSPTWGRWAFNSRLEYPARAENRIAERPDSDWTFPGRASAAGGGLCFGSPALLYLLICI